jgi:WD40 repeat protein
MGETTATAAGFEPTKTHVTLQLKHTSPFISCRFDPSGSFVFAGAQDSRVWRWDLQSQQKVEYTGHESWVRAIGFSAQRSTVITGGYDGRIVWSDLRSEKPKPQRTITAHDGWIRALDVSPDEQLLATVGNDLVVRIWQAESGELVRELNGHESHIYNVRFHPDGQHLVTADLKGKLIDWDLGTGKQARQLEAPSLYKYDKTFRADIGGARGLAFSPDGSRLACSGITNVSNAFAGVGNPLVVVLDWESGKEQIQQASKAKLRGAMWGVALHPDGTTIAVSGGGGGGFLLFWKPDGKEEFHQLKLPNTARDFDLAPDHLRVATAHYDSHVRIYRMTARSE